LDENVNGALGSTLSQIYSANTGNIGWLMYNGRKLYHGDLTEIDQTPDGSQHSSNGHTKGVVGLDANSGFWLVHSVPRFPNETTTTPDYFYPEWETDYGQSFLCMSYGKVLVCY
jgi:deoxyribonuclease-2